MSPSVRVPVCRCRRCGHSWAARTSEVPVCCARCKSPRWKAPARWRRVRGRRYPGPASDRPDPVVEAYKGGVDRTLIRENLRRSVEERFRRLEQLQSFAEELKRAGRRR